MTATMKAKNTTMSTELTMENQWTCFEHQGGGADRCGSVSARAASVRGRWVASGGRACRAREVQWGRVGGKERGAGTGTGQHIDGGSGGGVHTLSGTAWFMDRYTSQRDAQSTSLARHSTPYVYTTLSATT
jgi:hypothetical protein